jgi:predicted nucleic-acid-binding Zn-ribbon protein
MKNKFIKTLIGITTALILCCSCENVEYTTKDVVITGTVTKQYITEIVHGRYTRTDICYCTVVDYGGKNLKVIEDYDYYIRHSVGDEVELVKHQTFANGKWVKTEVKY